MMKRSQRCKRWVSRAFVIKARQVRVDVHPHIVEKIFVIVQFARPLNRPMTITTYTFGITQDLLASAQLSLTSGDFVRLAGGGFGDSGEAGGALC